MDERQVIGSHKLITSKRETVVITGVIDVMSFDAKQVVLQTDLGGLLIKGNMLHVNRLTLEKGELDLDGQIDSIVYSDKNGYKKGSETILNRLFK